MNNKIKINSNIKLSPIYGAPMLRKHPNKGIIIFFVENIIQMYKEIELERKKYVSRKKSNKNLQTINDLNESKSILMNEQQYIGLLSPFNSKLASYTNHIYTFTNRPYKQINKNLNNIYIICESAFLNMSSLISKPIVLINPNLIKITLFFY